MIPTNEYTPPSVEQRIDAAIKLAIHAASFHAKFGYGLMNAINVPFANSNDLNAAVAIIENERNAVPNQNGTYFIKHHGGPNDGKIEYQQVELSWEHVTENGNYRYPSLRLFVRA